MKYDFPPAARPAFFIIAVSCVFASFLTVYGLVPPAFALPDVSGQFAQTVPEIKINTLFNNQIPIHQGFLYSFQFKKSDLEDSLTSLLRAKIRSLNIPNENEFRANVVRVSALKWIILNFDGTKITLPDQMPSLVRNEGTGTEIDVSTLSYVFDTPTDPMDESMIVCVANFEWQALSGSTVLPGWPKTQEAWGKFAFTVVDMEPPHNVGVSPERLSAACGGKISEFAAAARAAGVEAKYPANPQAITVTVIDDNPFGASQQARLRHNPSNVDGFVMVQTYTEKYRQFDYNNPPKRNLRDPFEVESTIYEALDENAPGSCAFSYHDPVRISSIPGVAIKAVQISQRVGPRDNVAYVFTIPIAGLEQALEKQNPEYSKMPLHFASMSDFRLFDKGAKGFLPPSQRTLRLTFALSDSSGNWLIPDSSFLADQAAYEKLVSGINAISPRSVLGKAKCNTHQAACEIHVYDDRRPNPVIVMTNTETNHTDIFTLPNSDLTAAPYSNDLPVWEFEPAGASPAMKGLSAEECERFKNALTISEDVRLLFRVLAYDNINKWLVVDNVTLSHGVSTFVVTGSQSSPDTLRYVTWKINDPACANKSLLVENIGGSELSVFPEYIFRSPDPGRAQSVEFDVSDTSPFRSPPQNIDEPLNFSAQSISSRCNTRKIKLVFNVLPKGVSARSMGGSNPVNTPATPARMGGETKNK